MTVILLDHEKQKRLERSQPLRWDWTAVLSFVAAGLCAVALWKGIVWAGMVAYQLWGGGTYGR